MEEQKPKRITLWGRLKAYAIASFRLAKYHAVEKGSTVAADIVADLIIVLLLLFAFIFISITLALFLVDLFKSGWAGFGCVGLLYLLGALGIVFFKKGFERPIINSLIGKFMK